MNTSLGRWLSTRRLALLIAVGAMPLRAQDNFEIQVYGSPTVPPHRTMIELHSNVTLDGRRSVEDGLWPTEHAWRETLEVTHGFTEWFETGFYLFTTAGAGRGWKWVGDHIRPRVRVPQEWHWPVGVSISTEIGYQRREISLDTWTWEIRPIVDKQLGRWYLAANPALEVSLHGPNAGKSPEFAPAATVGFDVTKRMNFAIEYYAALGPVTGFDPTSQQEHQLFGAVNLDFGPAWECNLAVGDGITPSTDHLIAKVILGRRIVW